MPEAESDYIYLHTVDGKMHTKTVPAGNGGTAARNAMSEEWTEVDDGRTWVRRDTIVSIQLQLADDPGPSVAAV